MCGWIVVVGRREERMDPWRLEKATAALAHRGPDHCRTTVVGAVSMGFQRLAIIDLSERGAQPMPSADGEHTIVFNGEIFNYRELREDLRARGHVFASGSDTEVLLAAYREWGDECVHQLNGMFAFAVHNRRAGSVFAARDRLGEKPLYVWQDERWTVLASEPKAIGATGLMALRPDWGRLSVALHEGRMDHDGGTCLADIRQLPAAHLLHVGREGTQRQRRYWSVPQEAPPPSRGQAPRHDEEWVEELGALVTDSVRLRLRSDVPVGFTLSGGIDSSLLICEAAALGQGELCAFTYDDPHYDEREQVRATVERVGAQCHHVVNAQALDAAALLPAVVAANGEPVHSLSAVANFALYRRAHEAGVKVVLGGQAADEVCVGYPSFERDLWHGMALDGRWRALVSDVRRSAQLHGRSQATVLWQVARRAVQHGLGRTRPYQALRRRWALGRGLAGGASVFDPAFLPLAPRAAEPAAASHSLWQSQRLALQHWPLPMYLRIEDRVSMAHSVEARLPFADHRLVEHAARMPERLKFSGGLNKVALRAVAGRRVPQAVVSRVRKFGFPVGHRDSTAAQLQGLCRDLASTAQFRGRGLYQQGAVSALLARPAAAADTDALFDLAQVELWLRGLEEAPT